MNSAADVWEKVLVLMQAEMTAVTINTWFDDVQAVALEDFETAAKLRDQIRALSVSGEEEA